VTDALALDGSIRKRVDAELTRFATADEHEVRVVESVQRAT
jgi:hypothetical protein